MDHQPRSQGLYPKAGKRPWERGCMDHVSVICILADTSYEMEYTAHVRQPSFFADKVTKRVTWMFSGKMK